MVAHLLPLEPSTCGCHWTYRAPVLEVKGLVLTLHPRGQAAALSPAVALQVWAAVS